MIKYIRKNQKKALAFFGILLMVAFTLPIGMQQMGKGDNDHAIGTLYGKTVNSSDAIHYRGVWSGLKSRFTVGGLVAALGTARTGNTAVLTYVLSSPEVGRRAGNVLNMYESNPTYESNPQFFQFMLQNQPPDVQAIGPNIPAGKEIFQELETNEDALMLMLREAQANGIGADLDTIESIMVARKETGDAAADNTSASATRVLLRDLLTVINSVRRAGSVVKVSQPMADYVRATTRQQISLNLLDYDAKDFLAQVPAPTDEQLKAQFDKYKADDRSASESGFGYKFPNRVKFDAIIIPEDEVRKVIAPVQTEDVAEYYAANKNNKTFPTTKETFSLSPIPVDRPKSLTESFDEIRKILTDQRALEMTATIREAVRGPLRTDYETYKTAIDAKRTPPMSSLGVPYNSFEYLKKLRDKVQADHKVTLTITDVGNWMTAESLKDSKDFSSLMLDSERRASFPQFITNNIDSFLTEDQRKMLTSDKRPELWQPLPVFEDQGAKKQVIARVTAAEASHVPAALDEVRDLVLADAKMAKAYDLAKAAANKALDAVKSGQWLQSVANAEARPMATTGLFDPPSSNAMFASPITGYEVPQRSQTAFKKAAFNLLTQGPRTGEAPLPASRPAATKPSTSATTKPTAAGTTPAAASPATKPTAGATTKPASTQPVAVIPPGTTQPISSAFRDHPVGLIELPAQGKVIVAEVNQLKPQWTKEDANLWSARIAESQRVQATMWIDNEWLRPENLVARTGFQLTEQRTKGNSKPKPPTLPDGNLNPFAP